MWNGRRMRNRPSVIREGVQRIRNREMSEPCTANRNRSQIQKDLSWDWAAFQYDPRKEYSQHPSVTVGRMEAIYEVCSAKKFKGGTLGMCCSNGKIRLPALQWIPLNYSPIWPERGRIKAFSAEYSQL